MTILSLDIGKKGGVVIWKDGFIHEEVFSFADSMLDVYRKLFDLLTVWDFDLIVIGEAMGQRCVVKKHSKFYGVIEYFAEKYSKYVVYYNDVSCRARVLGKGNGKRKDMVMERYPDSLSPDTADAKLFIDNHLTKQNAQ